MSEYLESFGKSATLQVVFDDLYGQAEALVNDLNQRRVAVYGERSSQKEVPETELAMNWSMGRGRGSRDGAYWTTYLLADSAFSTNHLAAVTCYRKDSDDIAERVEVRGYRKGTPFDADYSLARREETGLIVCKLGTFGLRGQPPSEEPIGKVERDPQILVADMAEPDQRRLEIVTTGILENLTIVELIRDGASAKEALDAAGKVLISRD